MPSIAEKLKCSGQEEALKKIEFMSRCVVIETLKTRHNIVAVPLSPKEISNGEWGTLTKVCVSPGVWKIVYYKDTMSKKGFRKREFGIYV